MKDIHDIVVTLYDNAEVVRSFKIEHEKIAIRAFKEGLRPPLKHRIVNFEAKSLDELTKKAVEEEPFITQSYSLESSQKDLYGNLNRSQTFRNWNQPRKEDRFKRFTQNRQPWRNDRSENRFFDAYNSRRPNRFEVRTPQHDFDKQIAFKHCLRCNRNGHNSDTCYANLNKHNDNELPRQPPQVSFLEIPQRKEPIPKDHSWDHGKIRR